MPQFECRAEYKGSLKSLPNGPNHLNRYDVATAEEALEAAKEDFGHSHYRGLIEVVDENDNVVLVEQPYKAKRGRPPKEKEVSYSKVEESVSV